MSSEWVNKAFIPWDLGKGWRLYSFPGEPAPLLGHFTMEKVFFQLCQNLPCLNLRPLPACVRLLKSLIQLFQNNNKKYQEALFSCFTLQVLDWVPSLPHAHLFFVLVFFSV